MNPQNNNFLDNGSPTHPSLVDCPQRHNTSTPFEGAFALDPRASDWNRLPPRLDVVNHHQQYTPQPHLDHAFVHTHNTGSLFGGAVALDPCASSSATPQQHLDQRGPRNDSDDDDDDDEVDVYGGVNLEHEPGHADPAGTSHAPPSSGSPGHTWLYNLPPQSDPDLERRRRRALQQRQRREREQRERQQLESDLQDQRRVVAALRREAKWLQYVLQIHANTWAGGLARLPQLNSSCSSPSNFQLPTPSGCPDT
ncbi:uncharacterized protein LOC126986992 [Eriocheir sinensis]|uniref:uncharacterized protein LOC126986992 n=1 Tax=Eriocheir sinensis TaxID=95602 RepID=UPI0021CA82CB|nr:uncharacterized protein LOC126986992 [Eriocheir sinensis]